MSHGTFSTDSVIRGHHVYKDVWTLVVREELCQHELGNPRDPLAVSVLKESTYHHQPCACKISAICSMFLQTGGTVDAEMGGSTFDAF